MNAAVVPPKVADRIEDPDGIVELKALIAHPNHHLVQVIQGILTSHGAERVDSVEDEKTFWTVVADRAYDVVFVDEKFAAMPVFDFVRRFRRTRSLGNHRTPMIVLMTEPKGKDVLAARDAGVNEIIIKPFSSLSLSRSIGRALKPRRFIESAAYVGPDRRFRNLPPPLGIDRRGQAE